MGLFFDTPETYKDTTPSGIVWFLYMGAAALIWLIFVWDEAFIPAMLSTDTREYLVELARFFPGTNGRYLSLIEHGYPDVAQNYSLYFSINLIFFIGFFVLLLPVFWNDKKLDIRIEKMGNYGTYAILFGGMVVAILFIMSSIDYDHEKTFFNYEIHKGSAYYWIDLVGWSGLFLEAIALEAIFKLAFRTHILGEK